jgi:hypothetical protein
VCASAGIYTRTSSGVRMVNLGTTVARVLQACMDMGHSGIFLGLTVDIIEFVRIGSLVVSMTRNRCTRILV